MKYQFYDHFYDIFFKKNEFEKKVHKNTNFKILKNIFINLKLTLSLSNKIKTMKNFAFFQLLLFFLTIVSFFCWEYKKLDMTEDILILVLIYNFLTLVIVIMNEYETTIYNQ